MEYTLQIQYFGTGTSKAGGGSGGGGTASSAGVTSEQDKTVAKIAKQTRNLKNEQYRVINENGEVVLKKQGKEDMVAATVGEKRQYLNGAVTIHNHPSGGTFSDADLGDFGFHARQIVVASNEGTYKLTNVNWASGDVGNWTGMRDAFQQLRDKLDKRSFLDVRKEAMNSKAYQKQSKITENLANKWLTARSEGKPQSVLDKLYSQHEKATKKLSDIYKKQLFKIELEPYHEFYKKNASKYGYKYEYIKNG